MLDEVVTRLTSDWAEAVAQTGKTLKQPLAVLGLGNPEDEIGKTIVFVYSAGTSQPALVLKIARTPQYQESVVYEHEVLKHLSAFPEIRQSIPQPVGLFKVGHEAVAVETALPGAKLSVLLNRWKRNRVGLVRSDIERTCDWLLTFKRATSRGMQAFEGGAAIADRAQLLKPHLADIGVSSLDLDALIAIAENQRGLELPLAGEHHDLWPSNYFVRDEQACMIDWENFEFAKHPLYDFFFFLTTYAFAYPWSRWRATSQLQSFKDVFIKGNWYSNLVLDAVASYFAAYAIPLEAAPAFYAQFIIEAAITYSDRNVGWDNIWLSVLRAFVENLDDSIFGPRSTG